MYKCPDCPKEYENKQAYVSHRRHCKLRQRGLTHWDMLSKKQKDAFHESTFDRSPMPLCAVCGTPLKNRQNKFCNRECYRLKKRPKTPHSEETKRKIAKGVRAFVGEPKTTTIPCLGCGKIFQQKFKNTKFCSRGCAVAVNNRKRVGIKQHWKSGGYREGSGRSKSGWYKGLFCNSTYELIFVAYHIERGRDIKRCHLVLEYEYQGKKRTYHPDFEIEGTIYEIKGFWTEQAKFKSVCFPEIVVVGAKEIKYMQGCCSLKDKGMGELVAIYESSTSTPSICEECHRFFHKNQRQQRFCSHACGVKGSGKERAARRATHDATMPMSKSLQTFSC